MKQYTQQADDSRVSFCKMKIRIPTLIILSLSICACSSFDRRKDIASGILLNTAGDIHKDAYRAAFKARFVVDSNVNTLRQFIKNNKGKCYEPSNNKQWCEIPVQGDFCWAKVIGIDISIDEQQVKELQIAFGGVGC